MPDNIKKNPAFDNALPCSSDKAKTLEKPYSTEWMLLHCLGFGTCWGWVHVAFFSTVLGGVIPESLSLSVSQSLSLDSERIIKRFGHGSAWAAVRIPLIA